MKTALIKTKRTLVLFTLFLTCAQVLSSEQAYTSLKVIDDPIFKERNLYAKIETKLERPELYRMSKKILEEYHSDNPTTLYVLLNEMQIGEEYWAKCTPGRNVSILTYEPDEFLNLKEKEERLKEKMSGYYLDKRNKYMVHVIKDESNLSLRFIFGDGSTPFFPMKITSVGKSISKLSLSSYFRNDESISVREDKNGIISVRIRNYRNAFQQTLYPSKQEEISRLQKSATVLNAIPKTDLESTVKHYALLSVPRPEIYRRFELLEKNDDPRASMWLARIHFKGRLAIRPNAELGLQKAKTVVDKIHELAEKGDAEAQFLLGAAYSSGLAVEYDAEASVKWYQKATQQGHLIAISNLGLMHIRGEGVPFDLEKGRKLLLRGASLGARVAMTNLRKYGDNGRDDSKKLKKLISHPLVNVLGMNLETGLKILIEKKMITEPARVLKSQHGKGWKYHYPDDGLLLITKISGRIYQVEGHAEGFLDSKKFRGEIPLELPWDSTSRKTRTLLGYPDDSGHVASDKAHGMAYTIENVSFAVMFEQRGDLNVKLWRVFEKWQGDYSTFREKDKKSEDPK